jgi:hypothetical protein
MNRDEIVNVLKNGIATVVFTKVDGSTRTMNCTLNARYLPEQKETEGKGKSNASVSVWDTDKNAWRSFRVDSVQKIISL